MLFGSGTSSFPLEVMERPLPDLSRKGWPPESGILRAWCILSCLPPDGAGFQVKVVWCPLQQKLYFKQEDFSASLDF